MRRIFAAVLLFLPLTGCVVYEHDHDRGWGGRGGYDRDWHDRDRDDRPHRDYRWDSHDRDEGWRR